MKINFNPNNIDGELRYQVKFSTENREDMEPNLRIILELRIFDSDKDIPFLECEDAGYFTLQSGFGDFDISQNEEQEMVEMVLEELKHIIYFLTSKVYDRPLKIDFSLEDIVAASVESSKKA